MKDSIKQTNITTIAMSEIHLPEKEKAKLIKRDKNRLQQMAAELESGKNFVAITVVEHIDGMYRITDGRHRYIAHELACLESIDTVIASRHCKDFAKPQKI